MNKLLKSRRFRFGLVVLGPLAALLMFLAAFGEGQTTTNGTVPGGTIVVPPIPTGTITQTRSLPDSQKCAYAMGNKLSSRTIQVGHMEGFQLFTSWATSNDNCEFQVYLLGGQENLRMFVHEYGTDLPRSVCGDAMPQWTLDCHGLIVRDGKVHWLDVWLMAYAPGVVTITVSAPNANFAEWSAVLTIVEPTPTPVLVPTATPRPIGTPKASIYLPVVRQRYAVNAASPVTTTWVVTP